MASSGSRARKIKQLIKVAEGLSDEELDELIDRRPPEGSQPSKAAASMPPALDQKLAWSYADLQDLTSISVSTWRRWVAQGVCPMPRKRGGMVWFIPSEVRRFIEDDLWQEAEE